MNGAVKNGYRIKPYAHERLKWVVRGKEHGKWVRRFFEKKGEAETFAQIKNTELSNQGTEGASFSTSLRVMAQEQSDRLAEHGKTIKDAADFYLDHLARIKKSVPINQAIEELIENRKATGASNVYCYDLHLHLGRFQRDFPNRLIEEFSTKELDQWLAALNLAPVTRNTFRRDLHTLFSFCVGRGYSSSNPVEATRPAKDVPKPVGILTLAEIASLLASSEDRIIPYISIGAFAGLRAAEIERLDWANIDLESNLIEVTARNSKTARRRLVKILPNLRAWLKPHESDNGPVVPLNLRHLILDARRAAQLAKWPSNALRHSYASYHLAHFNDAAALALQMGHTNTSMIFQHYREIVRPKDAGKYWLIKPRAGDRKPGPVTA